MYHDAIEHQDEDLMLACADLLVQKFENIHEQGEDRQFLLELDVDNFVKILESDKLNITHENVLTELVKDYIKLRVDVQPLKELPPDQTLKPELWALLDETEKENRQKAYEARLAAEQAKKLEKREEDSQVYQGLDPAGRI